MAELIKKANALAVGGAQQSAKLYTTLAEVQNQGKEFVVDGVTCYAKYGTTSDPLATRILFANSGGTAALLTTAKIPSGSIVYKDIGTSIFTVPMSCVRLRVSGAASSGVEGTGIQLPDNPNYPPSKFEWFSGGVGGKGARVYHRTLSVTSGVTITITLGDIGSASSFGSLLGLACGGRGGNAGGSAIVNGYRGKDGTDASPQEANDGYDIAHFLIEWGGDI